MFWTWVIYCYLYENCFERNKITEKYILTKKSAFFAEFERIQCEFKFIIESVKGKRINKNAKTLVSIILDPGVHPLPQ